MAFYVYQPSVLMIRPRFLALLRQQELFIVWI